MFLIRITYVLKHFLIVRYMRFIFSDQFLKILKRLLKGSQLPVYSLLVDLLLSTSTDKLLTIVIDKLEVFNILNNLDASKVCGFDNISNKIFEIVCGRHF